MVTDKWASRPCPAAFRSFHGRLGSEGPTLGWQQQQWQRTLGCPEVKLPGAAEQTQLCQGAGS